MNDDGSEGCQACFAAMEYTMGENDSRLDCTIVKIVEVFMADHPICMMCSPFHHNRGYAYATILSLVT